MALIFLCPILAHADNCSPWRGPQKQAWFNEYFFGSGGSAPPNFLEVYSMHGAFPASWQGWSVDVYSSKDVKTTYPLNNSTATACTVSNKTWLTANVPGGLRQQNALVILKDGDGKYVDAFVFDNNPGKLPEPWPGDASLNWFNGLANASTGCKPLADALTSQAATSATKPQQYNMLVLGNYGNKDMARDPDGGPVWDLTSNTGAGTTYTQCVSNNTNFTKTVDNSQPTPGSTVTYTLNLANTGSSSMTGVQIIDNLPPTLTYISATSSNPADPPVVVGSYTTVNPNTTTGESITAPTVTWSPAAVAGGTVSKLYIKMQIPANATPGHSFVNTARTVGLDSNQTDFANITIGSPNTPSFAISVSPASSTTCTSSPLLGPKVTITAMSAANGGGVPLTSYNGVVTLTASTPNPKWYNSNGTALSGNTVQLTNGTVSLYLLDPVEETFTVSALDAVYAGDTYVMTGSSGNITFTSDTTGITLTDIDALTPAYGAVAGRPHAIRATLSNCGALSTTTAAYSGTIRYVPGINHPTGAAGPTINTASASCPGAITPPLTTSGTPITLNFVAGRATFYLCTTDVGQYALNLSLNLNGTNGTPVTGASSDFTVRPFAITATGFARAGVANPAGNSAFARAGAKFSGTLKAWPWLASADGETNATGLAKGNGIPDNSVTAATIATANLTPTPKFTGTTNNAGVVNLIPAVAPPAGAPADTSTYVLGSVSPATATLASGAVTLNDAISYSEVGNFQFGGVAGSGTTKYAVTNYLGAAGVNVPILSDVVGRITPDHFTVSAPSIVRRPTCSAGSSFTYMDEPFNITFRLTARNASGQATLNYRNSYAFFNPVVAEPTAATQMWRSMAVAAGGSVGLGALDVEGDLSTRLAVANPSASGWVNGENEIGAIVTFARAAALDGPFENLAIGIAPRDGDGITLKTSDLTLSGNRFPLGTSRLRFGRLNVFSNTVSGRTNLTLPVQAQFWSGRSWVVNSQDDCTIIPATAIRPNSYRDARSAATTAWPVTIGGDVNLAGGQGAITLTRPAGITSGTVDICIDLGADPASGVACTAGTPSNQPFLKGRWTTGNTFRNDPFGRASFGVYTPETRRTVHVRELF
ncbi:DUF6701 domain-containing protein [Noviherbaspirillum aerium]|uniref:DUF6701 domain-containing protein n=1 Tax=Noviherbaspirillum aerium TaxID=2588497 RepID=UPI00178C1CEA|nr:DUF6701 domain-containing protein [Noviherbaspirillum aerium]